MRGSVGDRSDRFGDRRRTVCAVRIIRAAMLAAVALTVVACGTSETASQAADASAVETVFRSYHQALLARDFATACALTSPEASAQLVRGVTDLGGQAGTCEEALTTLYATPAVARGYDDASRSLQVLEVRVTGDDALLTGNLGAAAAPAEIRLRRIDGSWKLLTPPRP